jgi:hypothetical protein
MRGCGVKWSAHRDWAGFNFGLYPTTDDHRQASVLYIAGWTFCIDLATRRRFDWRIQLWRSRDYRAHAKREEQTREHIRTTRAARLKPEEPTA